MANPANGVLPSGSCLQYCFIMFSLRGPADRTVEVLRSKCKYARLPALKFCKLEIRKTLRGRRRRVMKKRNNNNNNY